MGRTRTDIDRVKPFRDARLIKIYCCGEETEFNYFEMLRQEIRSAKVKIVPVKPVQNQSDPKNVVENAKNDSNGGDDIYWAVIDVDHNLSSTHKAGFLDAIAVARQANPKIEIAISNPCFEVWLAYHSPSPNLKPGDSHTVYETIVRKHFGSYSKNNLSEIPVSRYLDAYKLAKDGRQGSHPWPEDFGSDVYKIIESIHTIAGLVLP